MTEGPTDPFSNENTEDLLSDVEPCDLTGCQLEDVHQRAYWLYSQVVEANSALGLCALIMAAHGDRLVAHGILHQLHEFSETVTPYFQANLPGYPGPDEDQTAPETP